MGEKVTFQGNPLTLVGRRLTLNSQAPNFRVIANDLKEVNLTDFKSKIKVISSFPSLDTPVCDLQVKEFNKRAAHLADDVIVIGISNDLPFAQSRFCSLNDIKNEVVLSDYRYLSFGINYGLLIKELNLLARASLIIDKEGILRYIQIAPEITRPLNYEEVLKHLEDVINNLGLTQPKESPLECKPCQDGTGLIPKEKVEKLLAQFRNWKLFEDKNISKEFEFPDFVQAKYFLDLVAHVAQDQGHHPRFTLSYNKVKITLTTHAAGGLTENDFILAKIIDELGV
jgi:thiol peroxidase